MVRSFQKKFVFGFLLLFAFVLGGVFPLQASAQTETVRFSVESSYDAEQRSQMEAFLVRATSHAYFYVDKAWWDKRSGREQNDIRLAIFDLGEEFRNHIYPQLTSTFGSEPKPGIDKDEKITVLFHPMKGEAGGYFNSGNVYSRLQYPRSNEREMVSLNTQYITAEEAKSFLAHEFMHLITVNQKDIIRRQNEETWLNEARAEYAPTFLGYDDTYEGSNLQRRAEDFSAKPSDSLTDWLNKQEDYGAVNMFIQYLVDQYGVHILIDSLKSSQVGIASLNEALQQDGSQKDFSQVFAEWVVTALVNDCSAGEQYCYANEALEDIRITPSLYVIPSPETVFSTYHQVSPWNPQWHRLVGGGYYFTLEFDGTPAAEFEVPYVLCDLQDNCSVNFIDLEENQKGRIDLPGFQDKYSSLTIIPFAKSNNLTEQAGTSLPFSWKVTIQKQGEGGAELVNQLLSRVIELQEQVRQLQVRLASAHQPGENMPGESEAAPERVSCATLDKDLSFGMTNDQVRCLQEFLALQGQGVYPEGLITGHFGVLTQEAVKRWQEQNAAEVLDPLGLAEGTGFVGPATRIKLNQLL